MILLNNYDLAALYGLVIDKITGLWDFPALKVVGEDWPGENFIEVLNRTQDFQYGARRIALDCHMRADTWDALNTNLNGIATRLTNSGLQMLVLPGLSNRGYLVRLATTSVFRPYRYFDDKNVSVARFQIVFEEPQPFNVQFWYQYATSGSRVFTVELINSQKSISFASDEQKFVRVYWRGMGTYVNVEQEDYELTHTFDFVGGVPYPFVIMGEIDALKITGLQSTIPASGVAVANYFMRNGEITTV